MGDDAEESARRLAEQHGLRFVDLTQSALAPGAAALLTEAVARRHHAVPIGRRLGTPVIAVSDPGDLFAMDALRTSVGREFVAVVARPDQVERAIRQLYAPGDAEEDEAADAVVSVQGDDGGEPGEGNRPASEPELETEPATASVAVVDEAVLEDAVGGGEAEALEEAPEMKLGTLPPADDLGSSNGQDANGHVGNGHATTGRARGTRGKGRKATDATGAAEADEADVAEKAGMSEVEVIEPEVGSLVREGEGEEDGGIADEELLAAAPEIDALAGDATDSDLAEPLGTADYDSVATTVEGATPEPAPSTASTSLEESLREILAPPPSSEYGSYQPVGASTGDAPPVPEGYGVVDTGGLPPSIAFGPPLARVLVEAGRVTVEEMEAALREHQATGESLARYLYNRHMATEEDLVRAMAQEVGLEFVDLDKFPIDTSVAGLIPESVARHHMVLPIKMENGVPLVAMANPTDVFAMDDLRTIMGRNFTPVVATRSQIATHVRYSQNVDADVEGVALDAASDAASGASAGFELESLQAVVEDAPIVRYVNLLILQALNERASDIHIEPTPKRLRIRFRIDGVMHDATSASASIHSSVVSRLKVLGEMDITEHRVPQEGRVSLSVSDRQIDLRLATLPSMFGETCVMRLLDKSASIRSLPELGFFSDTLERYARAYKHPYGVILVTGPTGAGKTTTLYATLQEVVTKEKSVVTVEDPVEYQIDGITQVQINKKAGLHFSTALKSILRADPDVVLIGEIRDSDTATIAMEAALSGHLVLSTLHTNSAAATPLRLTEMGIEPFLVTSSLSCVLTQRLARILCDQCKEPYEASEKDFFSAGYHETDIEDLDTSTLYRAVGCRSCSHTGYFGRAVLAEVMTLSEEIDRMIIEQESIVNIERMAVEQGMRSLRRDGLLKALSGETTLEEVLRVVV